MPEQMGRSSSGKKIVVVGIGQELRGDDGVGQAVVRAWQEAYPQSAARARVLVCDNPGLGLLEMIAGAEKAVIVDAVVSKAAAGSMHVCSLDQLEAFGAGSASAHGFGAAEALRVGMAVIPEEVPGRVVLIGIEAVSIGLGEGLSPAVRATIPRAVKAVEESLYQS